MMTLTKRPRRACERPRLALIRGRRTVGHGVVPCSEDGVGFVRSACEICRAILGPTISTMTNANLPVGKGTSVKPARGLISMRHLSGRRANIRPKLMARDAGDALNFNQAFCRNLRPLYDGSSCQLELARQQGWKAALSFNTGHGFITHDGVITTGNFMRQAICLPQEITMAVKMRPW